jgi:hypothetical protein
VCSQLFVAGTWTFAPSMANDAQFTLTRHSVVFAKGTLRLRKGQIVGAHLRALRRVPAGRYTLTIRSRARGAVYAVSRVVRVR